MLTKFFLHNSSLVCPFSILDSMTSIIDLGFDLFPQFISFCSTFNCKFTVNHSMGLLQCDVSKEQN